MCNNLNLEIFQRPVTSNSKTFKAYSLFTVFPGPRKIKKNFKDFQNSVVTLTYNNKSSAVRSLRSLGVMSLTFLGPADPTQ